MSKFKVLKSGLTVIHHRNKKINGVFCRFIFGAGFLQEDPKNAKLTTVAHVVEHLVMGQGSSKNYSVDDKKKIREKYFASNAATSVNWVEYFALMHKKYVRQFFETFTDYIVNPAFTEEELESAKMVIVEEVCRMQDTPGRQDSVEYISETYDSKTIKRYRTQFDGELTERIKKLTVSDCIKFIRDQYTLNNCAIVINGNITLRKVRKLIAEIVEPQMNAKRAYKLDYFGIDGEFKKPHLTCVSKELYKDKNVVSIRFHKHGTIESFQTEIFRKALFRKFFDFIRDERNLSYGPRTSIGFNKINSSIGFFVECSDKNFAPVLNSVLEFIRDKKYMLTQEELDKIIETRLENEKVQGAPLAVRNNSMGTRYLEDGDFRTRGQRKRAFKAIKKLKVSDYQNAVEEFLKVRPNVFLCCPKEYEGKITHKMICDVLEGKKEKIEFEELKKEEVSTEEKKSQKVTK